jgi:hypothetical protein
MEEVMVPVVVRPVARRVRPLCLGAPRSKRSLDHSINVWRHVYWQHSDCRMSRLKYSENLIGKRLPDGFHTREIQNHSFESLKAHRQALGL